MKMTASWKESYDKPRQCVRKQRHHFVDKGPYSQGYGLSSSHVWMWEMDYKESRALKNWCFWTVGLEKTLESPLDSKEIKPVNLRGNQLWIFIGRTDAEAEALIMWPPDVKSWLIGKDPDAGKDWRQKEKRVLIHVVAYIRMSFFLCGEERIFVHCWGECKLVKVYGKPYGSFSKN